MRLLKVKMGLAIALFIFCFWFVPRAGAQSQTSSISSEAVADPVRVTPPENMHNQVIPIPIYSTNPSEGSTFGVMPVILSVRDVTGRIESIYAPSISYNDTIKNTATFRWYHYPTEDRNLSVIGSVSSHVNWNGSVSWHDLPLTRGAWTDEFSARIERSIFYRFYGFGPDTVSTAETSYTRIRENVEYRHGINLARHFNLGIKVDSSHDLVQDIGIMGIPRSPDVYKNTPGMDSSAYVLEALDLRYDDRAAREFSLSGFYANLQGGAVQGLWKSPGYYETEVETRGLWRETEWLNGSARFFWRYVSSDHIPFYNQSTLGGSFLLRGYTQGRFVDQGAWTSEIEQRFRVLRTNIFGVIADWQIDPFLDIGQVYSTATDLFDRIRIAEGVGFRAWVHPNISGRVDVAYGGEGPKVYVELGYPY